MDRLLRSGALLLVRRWVLADYGGSVMHFYVILRRETGDYVAHDDRETPFVSMAVRYTTRKKALEAQGPNTCVCGPYPTDEYGG